MALRPLIETLIRPVPVAPISTAGTPKALARDSTASTCSRATEMTTREADSENNVEAAIHDLAPRLLEDSPSAQCLQCRTTHSASVTANPPSAQSCADRTNPSRTDRNQKPLKRLLGAKIDLRRHPWRRSAASPSGIRFLRAHNGPSPSSTMASPLALKLRPSTLPACSMRPTTPRTGVG